MDRLKLAPLAVGTLMLFSAGAAFSAEVVRSGSVTLNISGTSNHPLGGFTTCSVTLLSNDPNNNMSSASGSFNVTGQSFSCSITVFYNWLLQNPNASATLSFSVFAEDPQTSLSYSTSETVGSAPIPQGNSNITLSVTTTL